MRRYRNILVGVDGSKPSVHALEEATVLAQWGKGGVTVIHVAPSYEGDLNLIGVRNIKAAVQGPGEQILSDAIRLLKSRDVSIRAIIDEGLVHERIAHHAMSGDADLVVLGAMRTPSVARLLCGRVLAKVVKLCPRDVMVIPNQAPIRWEKILFAFENSKCSKDEAARIMELALNYGGELRFLSVTSSFFASKGQGATEKARLWEKSSLECLESVQAQADQMGIKNKGARVCGRIHKVIGKVAGEERIGVIILGSDGGIRPQWGLVRSPIRRIVSSPPCPVLFLKY